MSENHDYLGTGGNARSRLSMDVLTLMLRGAGIAFVFCLVVWLGIAALNGIGKMLPDESRETEDPTPFSYQLTGPETQQLT